jgi:hypothetical protein
MGGEIKMHPVTNRPVVALKYEIQQEWLLMKHWTVFLHIFCLQMLTDKGTSC